MTVKTLQYGKALLILALGTIAVLIVAAFLFQFLWSLLFYGVWSFWPFHFWYSWFAVSPWLWTPFWWFNTPFAWLGLPALLLLSIVVILIGKRLRERSA